ncbi:DUF5977 domain-containing protein [Flavobacterium sp. PS2]|uniref:DUF5977 domain-containing protein n=1 Tax=Flavobacterium sp. PS2 TaxID=3384157 RepID=UPI00390CC14E
MRYSILTILLLVYSSVFSQTEVNNIVPLAPNTAAFVRYGEVPVNNFTGTANISIPIYNIKTNAFNYPLELNYHTGGNKVEDIASWVGLGWSLGTIPMISRSVKGIPDEETGGFFNKFSELSIEKVYRLSNSDIKKQRFMSALAAGTADSEPDIFYFNILGKSGKFIYSQEHNQFVTLEESQIKITYNDNGIFKIITEEGYEYTFSEKEISYVDNTETTTAWYVSKIVSPNKSEDIVFEYDLEVQTLKTMTPKTKLIFMSGVASDTRDITEGPITTITTLHSNLLKRVSFNDGVVEFNRNIIERSDLQGGYSLKNIKVKDSKKNEVLSYDFEYKFVTGGSCYSKETYSNKWMLLEKIRNTTSLTSSIGHAFFYDESYFPPCRNSPAQDYWGYYNGATDNIDLIPTIFLESRPIEIKGANRFVNPSKSQFGILKKIIYPTGGYTEFDFENNDGYSTKLPDVYLVDAASIDSSTVIGLDESYEETFTINNPPDPFLNGNNPLGGAYGDFSMGCSGCGLKNGIADANINFSLTRLASSTSPAYTFYISRNFNSYLQNGDYILNAHIAGAGQDLEIKDFFVSVTWNKLNPNNNPKNINKYIGGLRVKEIRSYPDALALPITKKYKYKKDYFSDLSSGKVFNEPKFIFEDDIIVGAGECVGGHCDGYYHRLKSYNNIQQVTYSGANVGYETVIEESNDPNKTGVTIYNYTHSMDFVVNKFPFPPPISMELFRGQPKEISYYKKNGLASLTLVEKKEFEYDAFLSNTQISALKNIFAFKIGRFYFSNNILLTFWDTHMALEYEITANVNLLSSEKTTRYFDSGNLVTVKKYNYNSLKHFLLTSETITNSKEEALETKYFYPQDPQMASEPFVKELIAQNRVGVPLDVQTFRRGIKLSEQKTVYDKSIATSNLLLPSYILENKGTAALNPVTDKKISYDFYDDRGNLLQYTQDGGTPTSIVWGYDKTLPVAKVDNIAYKNIQTYLVNGVQNASSWDKGTEGDMIIALNRFWYGYSGLYNTLITTYAYKPLVGISRMRDINGTMTYYDYDDFNRLKFVKDNDQNVLQAYFYNYKGQVMDISLDVAPVYRNTAISKTFYRANCSSGLTGPLVYSVSAGTYTSVISQQDADNKALNDMNMNGQVNANRNGYCAFWNKEKSGVFTKNNCASGTAGTSVVYTVPAMTSYSLTSQAAADEIAQTSVNKNGQAYANANGSCIYLSNELSGYLNMFSEYLGMVKVAYLVPAGEFSSTISQDDADNQAQEGLSQCWQEFSCGVEQYQDFAPNIPPNKIPDFKGYDCKNVVFTIMQPSYETN